jgi:hypothetical protein
MAKVNEVTAEKSNEFPLRDSNGQIIELNEKNVFEYLRIIVNKGFKESKSLTFKDGSLLHRYFDKLIGGVHDTYDEMIQHIKNALFTANKEGAYDINDAAVIDKLLEFIENNVGKKVEL